MSEVGVFKSKSDIVTQIEDLFSKNKIKESENKVINFDEVSGDEVFSDLEKKLATGFNFLFSQVLNLNKTVDSLGEKISAYEAGRERGDVVGVVGEVCSKGEETRGDGGGARDRDVEEARDTTVDHYGSKSWVTPSQNEVIKENRWFRKKVENLESEVDEIGQRGLKGMVVASAPDFKYQSGNKVKIESLFKDMVSYKPEGEPPSKKEELEDLDTILSLIKKKYGVEVPTSEVYGCHFLPNGMYCIRFVYRNPTDSSWAKLMDKIRNGGGVEDMQFYCNIQLTRKRRQLYNAVRNLKFHKRIQQYKLDVNGGISIKLKDKWMKITQYHSTKGEFIPTRLPNELDRIISG